MRPLLKRGGQRSAPADPGCMEQVDAADECCAVLVCDERSVSDNGECSSRLPKPKCIKSRVSLNDIICGSPNVLTLWP